VATPLPQGSIFKNALYTFYIGQNDFTGNLAALGISGVKQFLPEVISQIAYTIKVSSFNCTFDGPEPNSKLYFQHLGMYKKPIYFNFAIVIFF